MQKEHKENSFDGRENTSTSGEFGEIRRCFQWRHSREEPYTIADGRIIAQAHRFSVHSHLPKLRLKGKFSSGTEGALAPKSNYDFE